MTKICLVRHGETDWNAIGKLQGRTDIPLNKTGVFQAEACGEFLKESEWDFIITSPLKRAKQTAEIIKRKIDVPLLEMEEFIERHFGEAEGMTLQESLAAFPDKMYPNQESMSSLNTRLMSGLEEIHQKYKDKKILVVAHGAVIGAILSSLSNGEIGTGKTKLANASMNHIYFHKDQWKIKDFNQIAHLSSLSETGVV